ncbi:hypothetical protein [Actinoallomurus rhizosphaericola]|uniref:hypothetical protein n=1 Tax=Actinoallomurus rhizosphaericola TaxID=2952536 RepID=UPI002090A3C1|nr:hypothetical protein [Actinoallomurus rhizosphaericola]MCO5992673.1 hypothetical protein [Actinoallomurus rhizosphaericola]
MTTLTAPAQIAEGLRLLAHLLDTTTIPAPYDIRHCVLADNDAEGTAAIDRVGLELERAGIAHQVKDDDHSRELTATLATGLTYRVFYVYRQAMAEAERRDSYRANIR